MMRIVLHALAFLLVAFSGALHGLWTGRWGPSADLEAAAARCDSVSMSLGDWEGKATAMDTRQLDVAEAVGHISRQYVHRHTGQTVSVLLVCGRPGPISVHTPEVCYRGIGYQLLGKPENHRIQSDTESSADEFWTAQFSKQQVTPDALRIFWSWRDSGPWRAASNPRLTFASSGFLYKLYVVRSLASPDEPLEEDPCLDLMHLLLPELQRCLSPAS